MSKTKSKTMEFRLLDFKVYDMKSENGKEFTVQMFGKNEKKESASITVTNIEPFFYVKVGANWNPSTVKGFKKHINGILATKELTDNYNRYISGQLSHISPRVEKDQSLKEYVNNNFKTYTSYPSKGIVDFELVEKRCRGYHHSEILKTHSPFSTGQYL